MEPNEPAQPSARNFNTISPSAKWLLLMKGYTNIPYARQAAELMLHPEKYEPDFSKRDFSFWAPIMHFENRYWSIDQLMSELPIKNVLELSSGFSFRGLEMIKQPGIHYIDTDLPELIATKKGFVDELQKGQPGTGSQLEIMPLNALDEEAFTAIVNRFPPGEIVIVNEGLLMYLDTDEKKKLCGIIHKVLEKRGGYWITADAYIKKPADLKMNLKVTETAKKFFAQHNIEEKKFDSFEAAEKFFREAGFVIDKKAWFDKSKLSSLKYMLRSLGVIKLLLLRFSRKRRAARLQETWRLRIG